MRGLRLDSVALLAVLLAASCGGTRASFPRSHVGARAEPRMRVLLLEGRREVALSDARSGRGIARVSLAAGGGGLRVNGGPVVPRWRLAGQDGPIRVEELPVRGDVEVIAMSGPGQPAGLAVVNEIPMEHYLAGTLAREMVEAWGPDAMRAQAVASRTYALHQREARKGEAWHVSAGTQSQVYAGVDAESTAVLEALSATRGEVLTHAGSPILAAFHSSSGGRTASAEEVWGQARDYLVSVEVADEWDSPDSYWRAPVSRTTLGRAVAAIAQDVGAIVAARVTERSESGRVARLELKGESGAVVVTGRRLRSALGESILKSTLFELRKDEEGFVFVGAGNGHGVGMSQWGARAMARRGDDYRKILATFYPGTRITRRIGEGGETR